MEKKAVSSIVSVILVIGLTIVAGVIVFTVVKNLAENKLKDSKSCFNLEGNIEINGEYTCYNESGSEIRISISRKLINLDYLMVSISSSGESIKYDFYETNKTISGVLNYPLRTTGISLPQNESGKTYVFSWGLEENPERIDLAPVINENICNIIDEMSGIPNCA